MLRYENSKGGEMNPAPRSAEALQSERCATCLTTPVTL